MNVTMEDAVAAGDGTLHGAIDHWQNEAERLRQQFQRETLRTSELSVMLREWIERHEGEHEPGAWSRGCAVCDLVKRSRELLARPINMGSNV